MVRSEIAPKAKKKKMKNDEIMKELRSLRQTADKACADV